MLSDKLCNLWHPSARLTMKCAVTSLSLLPGSLSGRPSFSPKRTPPALRDDLCQNISSDEAMRMKARKTSRARTKGLFTSCSLDVESFIPRRSCRNDFDQIAGAVDQQVTDAVALDSRRRRSFRRPLECLSIRKKTGLLCRYRAS